MIRVPALACLALGAALLVPGSAPAAARPTLVATVGPGFTITLRQGAKKVVRVRRGLYTIVVRDRSDMHNFHLRGRLVNRRTTVPAVGVVRWTVRLRRGRYTFVCDPHRSAMKGSFVVR